MPATKTFGGKQFNSFSGADIRAVFGNREIGELQAISIAIQREKAPIYTLGRPNPRAYSRGKRGIAGTCVFVMFDSDALLEELGWYSNSPYAPEFLSRKFEYRPENRAPTAATGVDAVGAGDDRDFSDRAGNIEFDREYGLQKAWYTDQIPPFDITVTGANEYGATIVLRIIGVEFLNQGWGISVDDIVSEQQMSYVARAVMPWRRNHQWDLKYVGTYSTVKNVK